MSKEIDINDILSKYTDITVTRVPKGAKKANEPPPELESFVQVTCVPVPSAGATRSKSAKHKPAPLAVETTAESIDKEYVAAKIKLEQIQALQAHLAMLAMPLPFSSQLSMSDVANITDCNEQMTITPSPLTMGITLEPGANILNKYQELLDVIAKMRLKIGPSYLGSRIAKENLTRDIMQARQLVRECMALIERS